MANDPVQFEQLTTASGLSFGVATLDAPTSLNALSLAMVQALTPTLRTWAQDKKIAGVVLQGRGDKAFCAGGDIRELYESMRTLGAKPNPFASTFFAGEYTLDYLIHTYPKPLLCWGGGIVMGGGLGLMAGASHRVVTETSRVAMPEIAIGLYPDVGGSWILRRMPGRTGLFLGLTGAPLNASDALFAGVADHLVRASARSEVLAAIQATHWKGDSQTDRAELSRLLARYPAEQKPSSKLREHFDLIQELMAGDDLSTMAQRLKDLKHDDLWLMNAAANFANGSPTSAALTFELWRRVLRLSLAEVFRLEYLVTLGCCAHGDFAEGVRALLIDKDRKPKWQPRTLSDVTPELIAEHFRPRFSGTHPLQQLGSESGVVS